MGLTVRHLRVNHIKCILFYRTWSQRHLAWTGSNLIGDSNQTRQTLIKLLHSAIKLRFPVLWGQTLASTNVWGMEKRNGFNAKYIPEKNQTLHSLFLACPWTEWSFGSDRKLTGLLLQSMEEMRKSPSLQKFLAAWIKVISRNKCITNYQHISSVVRKQATAFRLYAIDKLILYLSGLYRTSRTFWSMQGTDRPLGQKT